MKNKFTFLALLIFAITSISFAQPYYVSTLGNDGSGDGSFGSPWLTIQYAVNTVPATSTIRVMPGIYNLTGSGSGGVGISIGRALTLVADDYVGSGYSITTTLVGLGTNSIDIRINASNVTIQGFTIDLSALGNSGGITITGNPLQNFHLLNNRIYLPPEDYAFQSDGNNDYTGLHINDNTFIGDQPVSNPAYVQGYGIYLNPTHLFGDVSDIEVNGNTFSGKVLQGINNAGMSNCTIDGNTLSTDITTVTVDQPYLIRVTNDNAAAIHDIVISNNNLGAAGPAKGGKNGIILRNPTGNVDDVTISGNVIQNGIVTGIHQEGNFTNVTYSNNTITNNPIGIEIVAGTVTSITNNDITNNTADGIKISGTATVGSISNNNFAGNTSYGVNNTTGVDVDAENNWWGSSIGPTHANNNTTGTGVAVSDNVDYNPWTVQTISSMIVDPVNGLTGVSVLPTFNWTDDADEVSYLIKISTLGTSQFVFNNNVIVAKTENLNVVTYPTLATDDTDLPLVNGTTYYEQILVQGGTHDGYVSEIYHFTTYPAVVPTLNNPGNDATVTGNSIAFGWSTGSGTTGIKYKLQWIQQTNAPTETEWITALSTETTNSTSTQTVLMGKSYWWRVIVLRSSNDEVLDYSVANHFTTAGGTTVTVSPSWPVGNATVYTNAPKLYWFIDQSAAGLTYYISYSTSGAVGDNGALTGVGGALNVNAGTGLSYQIPTNLTPGTQYYWQIRAYYAVANEYTAWSAVKSFTTNGSGTLIIPTSSYPIGGVTVYTTSPTLYWFLGASSNGLTFNVEVKEGNSDFTTGTIVQYSPGTNLYQALSGLNPGSTYYWRVQSDNGPSESDWSTGDQSFIVAGGPAVSYPVLTWPTGNPTITVYSNSPTLSWYLEGSSLGLTGYTVKYKKDSAPADWTTGLGSPSETQGQVAIGAITTTSYQTPSLIYGGHYHWSVATSAAITHAEYKEGDFTVVGPNGSGDPIISFPSDGSLIYGTSVTLSWYVTGTTTGIQGYEVIYSSSDVFDPAVTTTVGPSGQASQSLALSNLLHGYTYYWKVRSWYGGTTYSNNWSNTYHFTINPGSSPVVPFVGSPINQAQVNTASATLSWFTPAPSESPLKYIVEYATNKDFTGAVSVNDLATSQFKLTGIQANSQYYWRVKSKTNDGTASGYSPVGSFKTLEITGVEENENTLPKDFSLNQNFPNPFNPTTLISYTLPKDANVKIEIYNMLGQVVKTLVHDQKSAGKYSITWNGDNDSGQKVVSGAYIYRLTAGDFIKTMKLILMK